MDLVTQGLLGGALALAAAPRKQARNAALVGFASALLADADVLIGSADDPLLKIEFHRHFTHALIFIPVGALLAALLLWPLLRKRIEFGRIYLYALLGYATGGLLDACTSYGTHLFWPFSDTRVALGIIAIVDPLFSLPLLIGVVLGIRYRRAWPARAGVGLAGTYLLLGLWQHHEALQAARELAASRGHEVERILVKPTLGNLVLWRSVYQSGDRYYVDAIRIAPGAERVYPGGFAERFERGRDLPALGPETVLARDIERFARLSDGYVVRAPGRDNQLSDVRYSMLPTTLAPMWGIEFDPGMPGRHARFEVYRERPDDAREQFLAMLLGRDLPP